MKNLITVVAFIFVISILSGILGFQIGKSENRTSVCDENKIFEDVGLGFSFEYPCDFDIKTDTVYSREFALDEKKKLFGPVGEEFSVTTSQDENSLTISKVLEQIEASPIAMNPSEQEFEILKDTIVRFREFNTDEYTYGEYLSCSEVPRAILGENINSDVCVRTFAENVGDNFLTNMNATIIDEEMIETFDNIVLSLYE